MGYDEKAMASSRTAPFGNFRPFRLKMSDGDRIITL